ncbi:TetR/AcrR family transcriptional regulator [Pseudonocardia sp. DLS-67]
MTQRSSTENAMLDAAEHLFADKGFDGTRVRAIADASDANLGALHYYWGSKEALFRAVWNRRMGPLVQSRRTRLTALLESDTRPDVEQIIEIWVEAGLGLGAGDEEPSEAFGRLYGRALTDPSPAVRQVVGEHYDETGKLLVEALRRACPELSDNELYWRLHGLLGTILHVHVGRSRLAQIAGDLDVETNPSRGRAYLVSMLASAFRAPPTD